MSKSPYQPIGWAELDRENVRKQIATLPQWGPPFDPWGHCQLCGVPENSKHHKADCAWVAAKMAQEMIA